MSTRRSASMQKPDPAQNVVALRSSNLKRPVQLEGEEGAMQGKSISSDLLLIALAFFSWADWSKRHWHNTNSFALRSQSMDPKKTTPHVWSHTDPSSSNFKNAGTVHLKLKPLLKLEAPSHHITVIQNNVSKF